jgi:hypothetical protein
VHLPSGSQVQAIPPGATLQGKDLLLQGDLRQDLQFELIFAPG